MDNERESSHINIRFIVISIILFLTASLVLGGILRCVKADPQPKASAAQPSVQQAITEARDNIMFSGGEITAIREIDVTGPVVRGIPTSYKGVVTFIKLPRTDMEIMVIRDEGIDGKGSRTILIPR